MEYTIDKRSKCHILKLTDDVTVYEVDRFREAFEALKKEKDFNNRVILDLENVGFIDALALGVLTGFSQEIREKGGDLKIVHMNEDIKTVFDLSHLSRIFETYNNPDEAAKSFD
jgi:anti-anti-sigma factor